MPNNSLTPDQEEILDIQANELNSQFANSIDFCPQCDAPWDTLNNRCSANCYQDHFNP